MPGNEEDPTNVKPTALKGNDERPSKERLTMKRAGGGGGGGVGSASKLKVNGRENTVTKSPPLSPMPATVQPAPLLKLNEYAKNCSQADSSDSNCDFVKKVEYTSENVSSVSTTVDQSKSPHNKQSARQSGTAVIKRSGPTVVRGGGGGGPGAGSKGRLERGERGQGEEEKDKDKEKREKKREDSKESKDTKSKEKPTKRDKRDKEKDKEAASGLKKNERETTSKGRSKERGSRHGNKEHKRASKTDKGKKKKGK
ncbi:PREDICTED: splicing regulatory glutamine/lysine-rich protein 1-like [Rhagoletis zephyria]|uniref:splicing regulatory glutamine/lysine-rich protein 1-like n=1 Tax=Rhagoletis zephyria TaxID=28612 RepID=UPI0008114559|nr:PREDICTED: splicing regulatory glutamine/lysine-rich protein 1-like [Rhagoletis zephyria]